MVVTFATSFPPILFHFHAHVSFSFFGLFGHFTLVFPFSFIDVTVFEMDGQFGKPGDVNTRDPFSEGGFIKTVSPQSLREYR